MDPAEDPAVEPATDPRTHPATAPAVEAPIAPVVDSPPSGEPANAASDESNAQSPRSPITVEADRLEVEKDGVRARASGNVIIEWDTTKLRAAEVTVDQRERQVEATGGVTYESDDIRATASSVRVDVDEETGVLEDVDLRLEDEPGRFGGSRLEKTEGRRVLLDDGYFTTCAIDRGRPPDWELRGEHLDVRLDDYARMRDARLQIRGVSVLRLPYIIFPTKETRQSGLLPFSMGTSTNRGFVFTLPGYWAIDKHQDLTATAVVETSARVGVDGVYRYAPSRRRWGELHASYYNEAVRGEPGEDSPAIGVPEDRGSVELTHREYLTRWTGYADVQWIGDERFLREINSLEGHGPERDVRRTQRYTMSRVGALTQRGFTTGGLDATAYQDLIGEVVDDDDPATSDPVHRDTQHKPLSAWLTTDRNIGPVAFAFDSSLASFVRDKGAGGERLDAASTIALPLLSRGPVLSRAWANGRGTVYAMTERNVLDDQEQFVERLHAFPTRGIATGGVDARTKLAREFEFADFRNWSGLYHSIEPFAAVRFTELSSYDDIPLFDRLDAIDGRDVITYGIDQRFLLRRRQKPSRAWQAPLEIGRLSLAQTYNLSEQVVNYDGDDNEGAEHLSDIDLAAFVQPVRGFAVRTLTSYNVGAGEVRGANASISWETGPMGPFLRGPGTQVAAAYRYVRSDTADTVLQSTEMLARLGLTKNIALGLKGLYDIVGNTFVEKALGLTFTSSCDCWSVGLGVVDRVNPAGTNVTRDAKGADEELQVRFAFELKGLGGWGSGVTQRNSPALDNVEYDDVGFWRAGW
jgi:LPS-assembly protein